jgi:hypothetical protein
VKNKAVISLFVFFLLAACTYDAPLVQEKLLPIDTALLGGWEVLPENPDEEYAPERVTIRQQTPQVYAIEYFSEGSTLYFQGWLAELEGVRFLQLEVTGDDDGPAGENDSNLFSAFSYTLDNGEMTVRELNTDLVDDNLADTAALQAAFKQHKDHPDLFSESIRMKKL